LIIIRLFRYLKPNRKKLYLLITTQIFYCYVALLKNMDKTIQKALITAIFSIIIGVIVYSILGVFTYTSNTVIYDKFPEQFNSDPLDHEKLEFKVRNNAPLTFPLINPFYTLRCSVEAENDAYVYFIGTGNKRRNFTDYFLDIGRINAGDFDETAIYLRPDKGNLTLRLDVYLRFWIDFRATSRVYTIEYLGDNEYNITRIK